MGCDVLHLLRPPSAHREVVRGAPAGHQGRVSTCRALSFHSQRDKGLIRSPVKSMRLLLLALGWVYQGSRRAKDQGVIQLREGGQSSWAGRAMEEPVISSTL